MKYPLSIQLVFTVWLGIQFLFASPTKAMDDSCLVALSTVAGSGPDTLRLLELRREIGVQGVRRSLKTRLRAAREYLNKIGPHLDSLNVRWRHAKDELPAKYLPALIIEAVANGNPLNELAVDLGSKFGAVVAITPEDMARYRYGAQVTFGNDHFISLSTSAAINGKPGIPERHETDHLEVYQMKQDGVGSLFHGFVEMNDGVPLHESKYPTNQYVKLPFDELYTYARDEEGETNTTRNRNSAQRARRIRNLSTAALKSLEGEKLSYVYSTRHRTSSKLEYATFKFPFEKESLSIALTGKEGRDLFERYKQSQKGSVQNAMFRLLKAAFDSEALQGENGSSSNDELFAALMYKDKEYLQKKDNKRAHIEAIVKVDPSTQKEYIEISYYRPPEAGQPEANLTFRFKGNEAEDFLESKKRHEIGSEKLLIEAKPLLRAHLKVLTEVTTTLVAQYEELVQAAKARDFAKVKELSSKPAATVAPYFRWPHPQ